MQKMVGEMFPTKTVGVSRWISKESTSSSRFGTLQAKKLLDPLRHLAVDMVDAGLKVFKPCVYGNCI